MRIRTLDITSAFGIKKTDSGEGTPESRAVVGQEKQLHQEGQIPEAQTVSQAQAAGMTHLLRTRADTALQCASLLASVQCEGVFSRQQVELRRLDNAYMGSGIFRQ